MQPSEVIKIAARCKSVQKPDADTYIAVISNVHNVHDAEQAALFAVEGVCCVFLTVFAQKGAWEA